MSPLRSHAPISGSGFPRVSGDEPSGRSVWVVMVVFSPRERG